MTKTRALRTLRIYRYDNAKRSDYLKTRSLQLRGSRSTILFRVNKIINICYFFSPSKDDLFFFSRDIFYSTTRRDVYASFFFSIFDISSYLSFPPNVCHFSQSFNRFKSFPSALAQLYLPVSTGFKKLLA